MSMEPIQVTVHFNEQGTITPLHFIWNGSSYHVESCGRRWQDEVGQHILVMVSSGHIYELIFKGGEGRWYLRQAGSKRILV
jgi:hypothetical protein